MRICKTMSNLNWISNEDLAPSSITKDSLSKRDDSRPNNFHFANIESIESIFSIDSDLINLRLLDGEPIHIFFPKQHL